MTTCYICLDDVVEDYVYTECCKVKMHSECYECLQKNGFKCPIHPRPPLQTGRSTSRPWWTRVDNLHPLLFFVYSFVAFFPLFMLYMAVIVDEQFRKRRFVGETITFGTVLVLTYLTYS